MKNFLINVSNNTKTYWKINLSKLIYLIVGVFIFTMAIALYIPLTVGASQVDFSIFAVIFGIWKPNMNADPSDPNSLLSNIGREYGDIGGILFIFYAGLFTFTFIFGLIYTIKQFKKTKEKRVWIPLFWVLITDLLVTIVVPMLINTWNIQVLHSYNKWIKNLNSKEVPIKSFIFMGVFLMYIVGITFWSHSTWMTGPYNSICSSFMNMSGWNYKNSRMFMDFMMFVPGILALLFSSNSWDDKYLFLINNMNFATFIFIIMTGPSVNVLLNLINKKFDWNVWKNNINNKLSVF